MSAKANIIPTSAAATASEGLNKIHALLAVQTIVIILGSINRLGTLTLGYVAPNEFLRWVDFHNMLTLPLISLTAFYLLKKQIEGGAQRGSRHLFLSLVFIVGIYLLGASYGDHEVTNYLHARFCPNDESNALCNIVIFNDDEFSHWVFFTGFVFVNAALMLLQALFPRQIPLSNLDKSLLAFNGLFIGAGIFANLAFEVIGLDLYIVALLAALALWLLWRRGPQPLVVYYSVAYSLGLIATAVYKIASG
ncbi:MAG: hypothetical protein HYZ49_11755 [Chloroflexi bacterium]|nr:hypothetical protein [Chloroflexota bacterium]